MVKWEGWMDPALVYQVLASDPLNCIRSSTTMKWIEVSTALNDLDHNRFSAALNPAENGSKNLRKYIK